MKQIAFRMQLKPGFEAEYKLRHDRIWPQLVRLLRTAGVAHYSIFLDSQSLALFAVLEVAEPNSIAGLASHPIMREWWTHMADIMVTNPDSSPHVIDLEQVFQLK